MIYFSPSPLGDTIFALDAEKEPNLVFTWATLTFLSLPGYSFKILPKFQFNLLVWSSPIKTISPSLKDPIAFSESVHKHLNSGMT
ncbi:hypothetical protein TNCV_2356291 [Trichonephila clavipes]|nr:hypothetical protein TNCV_2356291 [Trichonephila clavipes]